MTVVALSGIIQEKKESLWSYIDRFTLVSVEVEGAEESLKCWIFENDLLWNHPFRLKLGRKGTKTTQEMVSMAKSYKI